MSIPAIVTAGDGKASRAVYGDAKVYLDVAGRTLVARTVDVLMRVPEVSEVWVVGNAARLERTLREDAELRGICLAAFVQGEDLHAGLHLLRRGVAVADGCLRREVEIDLLAAGACGGHASA